MGKWMRSLITADFADGLRLGTSRQSARTLAVAPLLTGSSWTISSTMLLNDPALRTFAHVRSRHTSALLADEASVGFWHKDIITVAHD